MAPLKLTSAVTLILTFLTPAFAQDDGAAITLIPKPPCPTITETASRPIGYCPFPTPIYCATPHCILVSTVSVPCGCPTTVPTSTSWYPCTTACKGGCKTAYATVLPTTRCITLPTASWTATTKPSETKPSTTAWTTITSKPTSTCQTITVTSGSDCPKPPSTCTYVPDCIYLSSVTSRCGCGTKGVVEKTSCRTTCVQGCLTQFQTVTDSLEKPCYTVGPVEP